jgi:hypothetical protein
MDENPINKEQERTWRKTAFNEKPIFTRRLRPDHYDAVPLISKRRFMNNPAIILHTEKRPVSER